MTQKLMTSQVTQNPFSLKPGFGWLGVMGNETQWLLNQLFDRYFFSPDWLDNFFSFGNMENVECNISKFAFKGTRDSYMF